MQYGKLVTTSVNRKVVAGDLLGGNFALTCIIAPSSPIAWFGDYYLCDFPVSTIAPTLDPWPNPAEQEWLVERLECALYFSGQLIPLQGRRVNLCANLGEGRKSLLTGRHYCYAGMPAHITRPQAVNLGVAVHVPVYSDPNCFMHAGDYIKIKMAYRLALNG
jgi:hypothetical protein